MRGLWIGMIVLGLASPALAEGEATPTSRPPAPPVADAVAKKAPPSPTVPPSSERFVFVPTGIDRAIGFISQLHPDCTSLGTTDYRVEVKPEHGTVTFQQGENYASYPMGNAMQHCNDQKSAGLTTHYTSSDGFVGEDHVDVLYLLPSATALEVKYTIIVK